MRVLLITNHFYPEEFRCNDLAFGLAKKGHKVTVLSAIPDYPKGKYHKGYGIFRKRIEIINNVKIYRSFIIARGSGGAIRLALNYGSSFIAQCFDALLLGLFGRFDYVLVHETSPVMVGVPGVIASKLKRVPMDFWVLDLWPESLQDAGGISHPAILGFFSKLTSWIYKHSRHILMSSRGFKDSILEKGNFENKLVYFPNWADCSLNSISHDVSLPPLPNGFRLMFAGNIGEAQDMDNLMKVANLLGEEKDIHFCIVGDGRKRQYVEDYIKQHALEETVHLLGRYPIDAMPLFFDKADVLLVTLKDSLIFNLTVPAKVQAYMNAGKPIIAMMNGEGPSLIAEARCGYSVPSGDAVAMAELIKRMRALDSEQLTKLGESGKVYCKSHFTFEKNMETILSLLND